MGTISQIDTSRPLAFYPSVLGKIDVPEIVALAEELQIPNLLKCEYPIEGLQFTVNDAAAIKATLDWLQGHPRWKREVESTLQCLAEDGEGRPLLTAFMQIDEFEELAVELAANGLLPGIRETVALWRERGATSGNLDGYRLQKPTATHQVDA